MAAGAATWALAERIHQRAMQWSLDTGQRVRSYTCGPQSEIMAHGDGSNRLVLGQYGEPVTLTAMLNGMIGVPDDGNGATDDKTS